MPHSLVSVLIPCYNAERFVEEAVRSVMQQTYKELQIICIDDCSSDATPEILQRLAAEDERILVLRNAQNLKLAMALNRGLEVSQGEYIARMDADDVCVPSRIEQQVSFLEQNPEVGICGGQCQKIDASGKFIGKKLYPTSHAELIAMLQMRSCLAHPTVMFRRRVYEQLGGYADMMPIEDLDYWICMAEAGIGFANLPTILLHYREHGANVTLSTNSERKKTKLAELFNRHSTFFYNPKTWHAYNVRFFLANWSEKTTLEDFRTIAQATNETIGGCKDSPFRCLLIKKARQKQNLAYLCCAKSHNNALGVRLRAAVRALLRPDLVLYNFKHR